MTEKYLLRPRIILFVTEKCTIVPWEIQKRVPDVSMIILIDTLLVKILRLFVIHLNPPRVFDQQVEAVALPAPLNMPGT